MFELLRRNPRFFKYWLSTWASEGGDWIRNMTLMYVVMDLSGGSAQSVSAIMFSEFAPIFLFGFLVGALADRWDRKRTILGAILFRIVMTGLVIGAIAMESLWLLYAVAFVSAFGTLFYRASSSAFTMQIVPEEDRKQAASLRQFSLSVMLLLGSAIGTGLYLALRAEGSLFITLAAYGIAWLLVQRVRVGRSEKVNEERKSAVLADMKAGFQFAYQNSYIRTILMTAIFVGFGAGLINVLEIFITTEFLGMPKEFMAVLIVVQGIAMLGSTFIVARIKLPMERFIVWGILLAGAGLGGMVLVPNIYVTSAALVVFSLGEIGLQVGMATLMQTKIAMEFQGRAGMAHNTVFNGFMLLAMLAAGQLHDAFSVQPVVAGGGIMIMLGGLVSSLMFMRAARAKSRAASGGLSA